MSIIFRPLVAKEKIVKRSVKDSAVFDDLVINIKGIEIKSGAKGSDPFKNTNCTFVVTRKEQE